MPVYQLSWRDLTFPPARLAEPDGLLAVGGDLSLPRLLAAYSQGIFPWYAEGLPILWYSTHPRCVLFPEKLHVPRSLARLLRRGTFKFSVNQAFEAVIRHCAAAPRPGQAGTWILPEMIRAYCGLHQAGYAHSVEVWLEDCLIDSPRQEDCLTGGQCQEARLVGGLYGLALGRVFFGESMFYSVPDASKAAVAWFVPRLAAQGYELIDCQQETGHMLRFGAEMIDRAEFLKLLEELI